MHEFGQGVEQCNETAVGWCRRAALQGFAKAQFNLGRMSMKMAESMQHGCETEANK
jgi:TPR repeat protein